MNAILKRLCWIACAGTMVALTNCGVVPPKSVSKDRAFIETYSTQGGSGGLRLAVKDNIDLKGKVTTVGSQVFAKHRAPAKEDAECMEIARERGVRIVGKTNMAEFALGTTGLNSYFGTPKNPLTFFGRLVPGGSSSGSAVAVATGAADVAFGTDTAGSVRVPAACCGVYGLKTTLGLVSLKGVYPVSKYLDTVGPLAANVENLVKGMGLLERGFEAKYEAAKAGKPTGDRIKVGRLYIPGTRSKIDQEIDDALAEAGFEVVKLGEDVTASWEQATKDGSTVAVVDGWLTNRKYQENLEVSLLAKAAMLLGDVKYPQDYDEALARRGAWRAKLKSVFRQCDLIALPTLKRRPFQLPILGRTPLVEAEMLLNQNTVAANFAGNPAVAVPVTKKGLPTSVMLVGPMRGEAGLVNAARVIEASVARAEESNTWKGWRLGRSE